MREEKQEEERQWYEGKNIDERKFVREFGLRYPMVYVQGFFYSREGALTEEQVRKAVYDYIYPYFSSGLVKKTNLLMETLKLELRQEDMEQKQTRIHCANGTYNLVEGVFREEKEFCHCRLPVRYDPNAPRPELWLKFLGELLEPEDILTLQEYLGYCLLPVNYAQKMLLILGKGGEGKSRIGILLSCLLGANMANGSLSKLEKSQFARADLQNRLVMVDDDLQMEALTTTGTIKSIITAEQPMDLERKGKQSYQGKLFCRLIAFGNGNLRSLHDRSHGFFRRQIILTTRPRPRDRVDDPFLSLQLKQELEGILLWCIEGLNRLLENDMKFTLSMTARENLLAARCEGDNTLDFMASTGYIWLEPQGQITSKRLYEVYKDWCDDNAVLPLSAKSFSAALIREADTYGLKYSNYIPGGNGRLVRGFQGIRAASRI